jgi:hypothetical protein
MFSPLPRNHECFSQGLRSGYTGRLPRQRLHVWNGEDFGLYQFDSRKADGFRCLGFGITSSLTRWATFLDTTVVLQLTVLTLILSDRFSAYPWPPLPDCRLSLTCALRIDQDTQPL